MYLIMAGIGGLVTLALMWGALTLASSIHWTEWQSGFEAEPELTAATENRSKELI